MAVSAEEPLPQVIGDGPLWTNPASGLWGPCLRMPSIADGSFEPFMWSLDYPRAGFDVALWENVASISEQACQDLTGGDRLCIYKVDRYFTPELPTRRLSQRWGQDE